MSIDDPDQEKAQAEIQDAREYAENIVETVREPLVVLNSELKVLTANHSFYDTFKVTPEETIGNFIYDLGNRQWDIPKLRVLIEEILPQDTVFNGYEVEHDFVDIGRKTIVLNARQIFRENIGSNIILLAMEDITERKRLQAEIQDAREYAENIVGTVREPLVVLNSELKVLTANHSFYDTFKVTPEETIGHFIYDLGNRQWDIPGLRVLIEEILPQDTVFNGYEVEHDFVDIGRKTIVLNARQIFRENIGSNIILLAMEDITERKRLQAEIQDAREYAENIVGTVREPLVVLNSELKVLTANHSFYDTFKVTPEETIGHFIYDLGNRQWDIPGLRVLIEEILPQDTVFNGYEVEHDFVDIGRKTIVLNARQIFRENIGSNIILLAMEDITERKRLQAEIQDAREYAENIVGTVREPLVVLNSELKVLTANHSFYDTFKVTPEETIGHFIYDLGNRQWDIPGLRVLIEEILPQDTVFNGYEVEHDFVDIGRKTIVLNARQIFRENIGSNIILLAMEDITERKRLQAEIQDAREYAENIVGTVREPLVVLNSELKVLTANHSFYDTFKVTPEETIGNFIYDLGNRQWDIPKLRVLIEEILPQDTVFNGYEVEHDFVGIGRKTIVLNARQIFRENIGSNIILLAMEDITERKRLQAEIQDAREYAENIVGTVREPLVVLNSELKVLTANHSFYDTFKVTPEETIGNFIYDLGNRQWDIPKLRVLIEEILPQDTVFNGYEVEHDFVDIGRKTIVLNARQIFRENIGSNIILLAMEDITERKRLQAEIQDAREYAENIVGTVREPLVVLNSELKVLTANHSFYDTFKVTPEETIGNFIYDLGNRQWDIPKLRVLIEEILPQDTVFNGYEVEHDFVDIGRKTIVLNARQIFRENIGSNIILLAMEDITERKRLQAEIQDAREYAENIVGTVREPLVVLNSELKVLTANHSFYDTFKVVPEETIGNFIYDLGNRQWDIPGLRVLIEEILPQDTVFNGYEVEHDFVDIGRKTIVLNARQIFRENIGSNIILLAMEDITERKRLQAEIQDAREYAENIVGTVREPLVVLNSELKVLTANHSFYDTFKVTPEETIGHFIYDLGNRQWDIPGLRVLIEEILPQDTVFNGYEVEHDFVDIGRKTIVLNARQIFRENIGSNIILLAMEDITERKRLQAEIQDAREYAENIVGTVREPLVVLNSELKVLTANHSFYDTFKVTPEETIGHFIYDLGNRQWDIPGLRVLIEEILPQDTVFNGYEVEHDFVDIGRKTIVLNARQIFRENIGSNIILLAMEDITERKRLQAEIQDAREYAENIVETVREPLVVLNSELKVLTANHSFYDTFKVVPEETIGHFIYELGNRQWDIPGLRVLIEEILPQDTVFNGYEVEHDFVDIGRKIIVLNARQIFRENIGSHIILLAMEDITERKRTEEALRKYAAEMEESKRLSDALNEIDTVLFSTKDYDVIMDRMLQLSTEAIGAETGVIFSKDGDRWTVRYEYKLPELLVGQDFSNTEVMHTFITAGTKRSLVVQDVVNSADVDQKFVEMLGIRSLLDFPLILKGEVIGDLTFHYHSSAVPFNERQVEFVRKLQISISLALENGKLLDTFKQSELKLQEANRELEAFNYTVAHDLRKPLTVINGYCQVLVEACSDNLNEQCKAYLKETYQGTLNMNRLIDDLLNFSRVAHAEPKREPIDLAAIANSVASELKLAEPARRVIFRISDGLVAEADPNLLRIVLANFFGNAWKYTSNREEAVIEFGATEIDGKRTYFVRDNGLGFDPADADKLFVPFQRLETGKEIGGLGIGLATVARIIQRHGGEVWTEGEPGKGATFYFTLGQR